MTDMEAEDHTTQGRPTHNIGKGFDRLQQEVCTCALDEEALNFDHIENDAKEPPALVLW